MRANGDSYSAKAAVQDLADVTAKQQSLINLHQQYIQSQQVPEPAELSAEEKFAKPLERMNWDDALDLARTSKYGRDLDHGDPFVQAGYAAVAARRARGE